MKKLLLSNSLVALIVVLFSIPAHAADPGTQVRVEMPLEALLTPAYGFEEKNTIQVVLYGMLPNLCYTLGETSVERLNGNAFQIRQYALHDTTGLCADEESMPIHMKMFVPFTQEVNIGHLAEGDYRFVYTKTGSAGAFRRMNVSKNVTPTTDTFPYAAVSAVEARDIVSSLKPLTVTVSGVLNSTCTSLDPEVRLMREDDVIVLLPTIKVRTGGVCAQVLVPFQRKVDLGTLPPGIHLIHVRSMNGKAVNKVIQVMR